LGNLIRLQFHSIFKTLIDVAAPFTILLVNTFTFRTLLKMPSNGRQPKRGSNGSKFAQTQNNGLGSLTGSSQVPANSQQSAPQNSGDRYADNQCKVSYIKRSLLDIL
jgi:hypothetical protein